MASLDKIAKFGVVKYYKADDIVCYQGEPGDNMFFVLRGSFDVHINSMTDFPIKVAQMTVGQFFGEMSLLDNQPRSATIISNGDCCAIALAKEDFKRLVKEDGEFALGVLQILSERIRQLNEKLEMKKTPIAPVAFEEDEYDFGEDLRIPILPKNHPKYNVKRPNKYDHFVVDKQVKCPVCTNNFTAKLPVFSRIGRKNVRTRTDLRVVYENFDYLWYNVWVCPHCNYANYFPSFGGIKEDAVNELKSNNYSQNVAMFLGAGKETIDDIIEAYYLVMICNHMGEKNPETDAKTWLRLYWLYCDVEDDKNRRNAARKTIKSYEQIIHTMGMADKIQIYTVMAELLIVIGDSKKAAAYYREVLNNANEYNVLLYKQAAIRLADLNSSPNKK